MGLPVAMVVFLLKTGIKQLDKDYSIKSFTEDVLGAFGEEAGNQIINLISESRYVVDNMLKDQQLEELGIDSSKTAQVRADVLDILKYIKISNTMLSDHDCDAEKITNYIINNFAFKIKHDYDESAIRDIKRVLFEIIQTNVNLAKQNSSYIVEIIFKTHNVVNNMASDVKDTASDVKEIKSGVRGNTDILLNQTDILNRILEISLKNEERTKEFKASRTHLVNADNSQPTLKTEQKVSTDSDTRNFLIAFFRRGAM